MLQSFLFIVSKDIDNKETIENFETLVSVNKKELELSQEIIMELMMAKRKSRKILPAVDLDISQSLFYTST